MSYVGNVTVYVDWDEVREWLIEVAASHLDKEHAKLLYMDPEVGLIGGAYDGFAVSFVTEERDELDT